MDLTDILFLIALTLATLLYWKSRKNVPPPPKTKKFPINIPNSKPSPFVSLDKGVVLFYGSQTGTAEDFARRLSARIYSDLQLNTHVCDLGDVDFKALAACPSEILVIFMLATYGEGEPTDNAIDFCAWLKEEPELNFSYMMFGLGNKTYQYFNQVARDVDKMFKNAGANRIGERGEGDDDACLEADFTKWQSSVMPLIAKHFGVHQVVVDRKATHVPMFLLEKSSSTLKRESIGSSSNLLDQTDTATIIKSETLYQNALDIFPLAKPPKTLPNRFLPDPTGVKVMRQCYHIEFDIGNQKYTTGDHLGIWPLNNPSKVKELCVLMNLSDNALDQIYRCERNQQHSQSAQAKLPLETPSTLRDILTRQVDLQAIVKTSQMEILLKYCSNEQESKRIMQLIDDPASFSLISKHQKTVMDLLREFPSIKVPLSVLLCELLPHIRQRYYSISSSSLEQPHQVSVTAVLVRYALDTTHLMDSTSSIVSFKEGLATSWLERMHETEAQSIMFYIRHSNFKLPAVHSLPVVMVGPGTGVAPFRGFLRERCQLAKTTKVGKTLLFYGCRHADKDHLYQQEFRQLVKEGQELFDVQVHTAYSRMEGQPKTYVQHLLKKHAKEVWEMIREKGGYFYVCGDAKNMARDVNQCMIDMAIQIGGLIPEQANRWVQDLRSSGRYLEDVWS